jgi:hypothetical protein
MLAMFEPVMSPNETLGAFSNADVIPTNSSGNDVPRAKIMTESAKTPV